MYNQSNIRLHVYLFIKYVYLYQIMFILTTTMASHSLYWIYSLLFLVAYTLWQPFVAYFRSDIDIIVFFCWAGWKWVGRRDYLTKKNFFFTSSGAQRWAEREMGNTNKNTATLLLLHKNVISVFIKLNIPDPPQPESEEVEAPISPRKITTSMAISSINATITFLEGHPELAKKHLQPLLETLTDIKQLSINTAQFCKNCNSILLLQFIKPQSIFFDKNIKVKIWQN